MEWRGLLVLFCTVTVALTFPAQEAQLVTESKPGQEYVFVQSSSSGARPISRKDKTDEKQQHFETAHKIPPRLTFALNDAEDEEVPVKPVKTSGKKVHKRQAAESPAPAPPGAIKLNVAQLLEKYKSVMKTTEAPSTTTTTTTARPSRRRIRNRNRSRRDATTPSSVLTTAKISPKSIDTDVVGSASEKQRSRIQIKKGPNGQDYEYEYVYYYYDDDEDAKDKKSSNAHDGPAKNSISRNDKQREKHTPEVNEVVPSRSKSRSRQLGEEESVQEERLPANTRFPPRSRNLQTTPLPEEEAKSTVARARGRGRPAGEGSTAAPEEDNASEETQGSRGRTRANVRRPSLELVDSESFNTHSAAPAPSAAHLSPNFPAQLPAGPEEPADKPATPKSQAPIVEESNESSKPEDSESTTSVTGMNKIALDLYAISQGTQKLFGDEGSELSTEEGNTDVTTVDSSSTEEIESTTPTTTTTTTTTTTPAPTTTKTTTTTTTSEAPTKASRFGGRRSPLSARKSSTTTTTEAPTSTEAKPKKFGRPSFGNRARTKTTAAPAAVEEEVSKEESKSVSQAKPTRSRFGGPRSRGRTTAAPSESKEDSSTAAPAAASSSRSSLPRARPAFNSLRTRGRTTTTAAPSSEGETSADSEASSSEPSSTTARPGRRIAGSNANIKALRPGPRINLVGRRGQSTTTSTEASAPETEDHVTGDEDETNAEAASEKEEAPAPVDNSPLGRLRSKSRINIQPKAKSASAASASAPVQVRRVNPLLARRRPGQTTEAPSSSEAPSSEATVPEAEEETAETEPSASSSSSTTTEEPRGLNKLLAGRRRLATRTPGTINHK